MDRQRSIIDIIGMGLGICNPNLERGILLIRKATKSLTEQWRRKADGLHIAGSIDRSLLHLTKPCNIYSHYQGHRITTTIFERDQGILGGNIRGIKGAKNRRWSPYTNTYRRLSTTTFLTCHVTLLIARVGRESTYNIPPGESGQHYYYQKQNCESFPHQFTRLLSWHVLLVGERIHEAIISSCIRADKQTRTCGMCHCVSLLSTTKHHTANNDTG